MKLPLGIDSKQKFLSFGFCSASTFTVAASTTVCILPTSAWSPSGLFSLGVLSVIAGFLLLLKHDGPLIPAVRQTLGAFLAVYGACAIVGGLSGHDAPTAPLRSFEAPAEAEGSLWKLARSEGEGRTITAAAIAANQKSLILWTEPVCPTCSAVEGLSALNPSINPGLGDYRLIRIEVPGSAKNSLRERFGVHSSPALTLMQGDGSVPAYGRIEGDVDAQSVMDLLDIQEQAEAAAR